MKKLIILIALLSYGCSHNKITEDNIHSMSDRDLCGYKRGFFDTNEQWFKYDYDINVELNSRDIDNVKLHCLKILSVAE